MNSRLLFLCLVACALIGLVSFGIVHNWSGSLALRDLRIESDLFEAEESAFRDYLQGEHAFSISNYQHIIPELEFHYSKTPASDRGKSAGLRLWLARARLARSLEAAGERTKARSISEQAREVYLVVFPAAPTNAEAMDLHLQEFDKKQSALLKTTP
jgi:hypothetical protein